MKKGCGVHFRRELQITPRRTDPAIKLRTNMLYKPGPYKNSIVRRTDGVESRDLRAVCDNLEKELDRKDSRNDNLSRELLTLRESYANQQVITMEDYEPHSVF